MTRIVIIGGGPAGYEAALVAVQYGAEVTLIERDGIGGACVLSDCVPSKTFIASAGGRTAVLAAGSLGVMVDPDKVAVDVAVVHGRVAGLALAQSADIRASLIAERRHDHRRHRRAGRSAARAGRAPGGGHRRRRRPSPSAPPTSC